MSLNKQRLADLDRHAATVFPGASADRRAELVQEAVRVALERDPSAKADALVELVKAVLPAVAQVERNLRRRGGAVHEAGEGLALPVSVRRQKRRPHLPRGLIPVLDESGAHVVPDDIGDLPDLHVRVAARRLVDEVLQPIFRSEPLHPRKRAALLQAYRHCFGSSCENAWAAILTREIQDARRRLLAAQEATARQNEVPPATTNLTFTKTPEGEQAYPDLPSKFATNVRRRVIATDGNTTTVELTGEIGGEIQVVGYLIGAYDDRPALDSSATPLSQAPYVLLRALEKSAHLGYAPPLPDYVMDHELVAWLIERAGFDGGGGSKGKLSGASIERLLSDPVALAQEVEAYGTWHAERLSEQDAAVAERGYADMACRVRARGQQKT
jgi:hypothetical protein